MGNQWYFHRLLFLLLRSLWETTSQPLGWLLFKKHKWEVTSVPEAVEQLELVHCCRQCEMMDVVAVENSLAVPWRLNISDPMSWQIHFGVYAQNIEDTGTCK